MFRPASAGSEQAQTGSGNPSRGLCDSLRATGPTMTQKEKENNVGKDTFQTNQRMDTHSNPTQQEAPGTIPIRAGRLFQSLPFFDAWDEDLDVFQRRISKTFRTNNSGPFRMQLGPSDTRQVHEGGSWDITNKEKGLVPEESI